MFIDFINLCRWERKNHNSYGQCVFGDALFLKIPEKINYEKIGLKKVCSFLSIMIVYRRYDLIRKTLGLLPKNLSPKFKKFESKLDKIIKLDNRARFITNLSNRFLLILGTNYKNHLM